jgi:hypothetical protein
MTENSMEGASLLQHRSDWTIHGCLFQATTIRAVRLDARRPEQQRRWISLSHAGACIDTRNLAEYLALSKVHPGKRALSRTNARKSLAQECLRNLADIS